MREEGSATPVDEKGRKKRSMKLEVSNQYGDSLHMLTVQHLVHQQANRRLGIMYNVSKFESKGDNVLPDPSSTPLGPDESVNGVQEFRPDFSAGPDALTVKPFLEQVTADVTYEWENGVARGEHEATPEKIRESVEVYWIRLGVSAASDIFWREMLTDRNVGMSSVSELLEASTRMRWSGANKINTVDNSLYVIVIFSSNPDTDH
jgi:hypothetical protein